MSKSRYFLRICKANKTGAQCRAPVCFVNYYAVRPLFTFTRCPKNSKTSKTKNAIDDVNKSANSPALYINVTIAITIQRAAIISMIIHAASLVRSALF